MSAAAGFIRYEGPDTLEEAVFCVFWQSLKNESCRTTWRLGWEIHELLACSHGLRSSRSC